MASVTLSERQQKMLDYIIHAYLETQFPPTIREIGEQVGISSTSVVNYNLTRLEEADLLTRHQKVSRGLALNWPRLVELRLVDENDVPPMMLGTSEATNGHGHSNGTSQEFTTPRIPLLGTIAAGEPLRIDAADRRNPLDWVDVSEAMLTAGHLGRPDELYALRVKGDSMIDASIRDGDIVIMRQAERAENGQMVAAWLEEEEETTLKYWQLRGSKVYLEPDNPAYEPIICDAANVRVMGRIVSVIRYYN